MTVGDRLAEGKIHASEEEPKFRDELAQKCRQEEAKHWEVQQYQRVDFDTWNIDQIEKRVDDVPRVPAYIQDTTAAGGILQEEARVASGHRLVMCPNRNKRSPFRSSTARG